MGRASVDCVNWAVDWSDQMTINLFHQCDRGQLLGKCQGVSAVQNVHTRAHDGVEVQLRSPDLIKTSPIRSCHLV